MSGWDQDRVRDSLRRGDFADALRYAQRAYGAENLRSPFEQRAQRMPPGTVMQDHHGILIEGVFRVVSHGR